MESDIELARWAGNLIWPLLVAGAAAFSFLALLAYEHLKVRALVDLVKAAAGRRPALENGLRRLLEREGVPRAKPGP